MKEGVAGREGGFVLLPAKVSAPAPDAFAVVRSRAQARFAGAWERPLTTVVAPCRFRQNHGLRRLGRQSGTPRCLVLVGRG